MMARPTRRGLITGAAAMAALAAHEAQAQGIPGMIPGGGFFGRSGTTWNPADTTAGVTFTNNNLTASSGATDAGCRSTTFKQGKLYVEVVESYAASTDGFVGVGVSKVGAAIGTFPGSSGTGDARWQGSNQVYVANGSAVGTSTSAIASGQTLGVCVDTVNGKFWVAINNAWVQSGNPATNTGGVSISAGVAFAIYLEIIHNSTGTLQSGIGRFTAASQTYAAPSGFTAWG